jgi:hypothetical protein
VARWRKRDQWDGVPEELCRFVLGEWPGCAHEQVQAWSKACLAWVAADVDHVLPIGDPVDILNAAGRISRQYPPCPHEYRPAQHWANGPPA